MHCILSFDEQLKVGNSDDCIPHKGRWNFNNKVFISTISKFSKIHLSVVL